MYAIETPVGMQNLKLKYIYLWPIQKDKKKKTKIRTPCSISYKVRNLKQ
jgi:hypothetical protein